MKYSFEHESNYTDDPYFFDIEIEVKRYGDSYEWDILNIKWILDSQVSVSTKGLPKAFLERLEKEVNEKVKDSVDEIYKDFITSQEARPWD